jgi:hypothetical protein
LLDTYAGDQLFSSLSRKCSSGVVGRAGWKDRNPELLEPFYVIALQSVSADTIKVILLRKLSFENFEFK